MLLLKRSDNCRHLGSIRDVEDLSEHVPVETGGRVPGGDRAQFLHAAAERDRGGDATFVIVLIHPRREEK